MSAYSDAWQALEAHHADTQHVTLRERFAADAERFNNMHEILHGLLFDYSKNRLDENTLDLLCQLAEAADLPQYMQAMSSGEKINTSEHRAVLHTALRLPANAKPVYVDGENIVPNVHHELNRALEFARQLLDGTHAGITGKPITDLVHIGIGGSDLGPRMATQALQPYWQNIHVHFVSNSDDADLTQTLLGLNPETTVFSIASKSFRTPETLLNAYAARTWYRDAGLPDSGIYRHFCAISADVAAAQNFGISPDKVFAMSDWVGGRYSVWSPIGLPLMVAVGEKAFRKMLAGAHAMDTHFFETPFRRNIPVLMALINVWYNHRQHRFTVANAFAQAEALMKGKTLDEVQIELAALPQDERDRLAPQKEFPGNRPSNSLLIDSLTPFNLGMLMAAYEHRTFVQGVIWRINPFDQWGVEYGKELAKTIEPELERGTPAHDSSTNGLIAFYRNCNARSKAV